MCFDLKQSIKSVSYIYMKGSLMKYELVSINKNNVLYTDILSKYLKGKSELMYILCKQQVSKEHLSHTLLVNENGFSQLVRLNQGSER